MEEVIRKLIYYQERETRELLGKNSHRLGRIVTSRSGPHGMTEIWEDGTAHKVRLILCVVATAGGVLILFWFCLTSGWLREGARKSIRKGGPRGREKKKR
jgi:hypothetical protein